MQVQFNRPVTLTADDGDDSGDGLDPEGRRDLLFSIHVHLREDPATAVLDGQLLQHRAQLLARATPGGP